MTAFEPKHVGSLFRRRSNYGVWKGKAVRDDTLYIERRGKVMVITSIEFYAPFSVCLDKSFSFEGDAMIDEEHLRFGNVSVKKSTVTLEEPIKVKELYPLSGKGLDKVESTIKLLYPEEEELEFVISSSRKLAELGSTRELYEGLCSLVGRGRGLTPSGDDMVSGFLSVYNAASTYAGRRKLCISSKALEKTNSFGRSMIYYSQSLQLDKKALKLVTSLLEGDLSLTLEAVLELSKRGHSSGLDYSVGALSACRHILSMWEVVKREERTE